MSSPERLPLLPLDDTVVLPGMAVPVELTDAEARGAVDAATDEPGPTRGLLAPRPDPAPPRPPPRRPLRQCRHRCSPRPGRPAARWAAGCAGARLVPCP